MENKEDEEGVKGKTLRENTSVDSTFQSIRYISCEAGQKGNN